MLVCAGPQSNRVFPNALRPATLTWQVKEPISAGYCSVWLQLWETNGNHVN
jgi:hypothetical protein